MTIAVSNTLTTTSMMLYGDNVGVDNGGEYNDATMVLTTCSLCTSQWPHHLWLGIIDSGGLNITSMYSDDLESEMMGQWDDGVCWKWWHPTNNIACAHQDQPRLLCGVGIDDMLPMAVASGNSVSSYQPSEQDLSFLTKKLVKIALHPPEFPS